VFGNGGSVVLCCQFSTTPPCATMLLPVTPETAYSSMQYFSLSHRWTAEAMDAIMTWMKLVSGAWLGAGTTPVAMAGPLGMWAQATLHVPCVALPFVPLNTCYQHAAPLQTSVALGSKCTPSMGTLRPLRSLCCVRCHRAGHLRAWSWQMFVLLPAQCCACADCSASKSDNSS